MGIEIFGRFDRGRRVGLQIAGALLADHKGVQNAWYVRDPSRPEPVLDIEVTPPQQEFEFQLGTGKLGCPAGNISKGRLELNFNIGTLRNEPLASPSSALKRRFILQLPDSYIGFGYKIYHSNIVTLADLYQRGNEADTNPTRVLLFRSTTPVGDIKLAHSLQLSWTGCILDSISWDNSDIANNTTVPFHCN